jgi:hypothetical protein
VVAVRVGHRTLPGEVVQREREDGDGEATGGGFRRAARALRPEQDAVRDVAGRGVRRGGHQACSTSWKLVVADTAADVSTRTVVLGGYGIVPQPPPATASTAPEIDDHGSRKRRNGPPGNAFAILGACFRALREAGVSEAERERFEAEAAAGNYDHLLGVVMRWFDVE